jgi:hypothetical protein
MYNHNMSQPLNKDAVLDHWVALNPTIPNHEPYHDRASNLVVEIDDERTKADRPVNQQPSRSVFDDRTELLRKQRNEKKNSKRRASRAANRAATHSAIRSTASTSQSADSINNNISNDERNRLLLKLNKEITKLKRQRSAQSSILSSPSTTVADAVTHNSYIDVSIFIHTKLTTYSHTDVVYVIR